MRRALPLLLVAAGFSTHGLASRLAAQGPAISIPGLPGLPQATERTEDSPQALEKQAKAITLGEVKFDKISAWDALSKLEVRLQSRPQSEQTAQPGVMIAPSNGVMMQGEKLQVTLHMKDTTLHAVLTEIARQAQLELSFDEQCANLTTKEQIADRKAWPAQSQKPPWKRAQAIVLPSFTPTEATLPELAKSLNALAKEADPAKRGVPIELSPGAAKAETRVTLKLQNVPVSDVINYIVDLANIRRKVDDEKIVLAAHGDG